MSIFRKKKIDFSNLPKHVAFIMDGNGRWAKIRGKIRTYGHKQGVEAVEKVIKHAKKLGLEIISFYAFSTENWKRPKEEVDAIMNLLEKYLHEAIDRMAKDLKDAFPDMSGFSPRNIKYMRKFAECWPDFEIVQQVVAQIPWRTNRMLLDKLENQEERICNVTVAKDQLSLAIGKEGQNARLAAKLTGYKVDIKAI